MPLTIPAPPEPTVMADSSWLSQLLQLLRPDPATFDPSDLMSEMPTPLAPAAMGMAKVGRRFGKAGARIPRGQQSFTGGALKVPRFRSELGTFIKHQGDWWRLQPFQATDAKATIEWLGDADEIEEAGEAVPKLVKQIPMSELIDNARKHNKYNTEAASKPTVARRRKK